MLHEIDQILNSFSKKSHVLIVNGHQGYLALHLAKRGFQVTILESNASNYELIVTLGKKYKVERNLKIVKWEDTDKLPEIEEEFELVICAHTFLLTGMKHGTDASRELFLKIKEACDYVLIIELRHDHNKWWDPYVENFNFSADFIKEYNCPSLNNRMMSPKIQLISDNNTRRFTFFDEEQKEIVTKNYPTDERNQDITIYQSKTKIIKEVKYSKAINNSAEKEKFNIENTPKRIQKKLKLPTYHETQKSSQSIFYIRDKINGLIVDENIELKQENLQNLIEIICNYSKNGYFHNDLRPWNLIVNNKEIALIDFEFLSKADNEPTGFPQWIAMLAIFNFLQQKNPRTWNLEKFITSSAQKIDFRDLASQIYFEEAWNVVYKYEKNLKEMDYLDVDNAIENFKMLIDKRFTKILCYWRSDSMNGGVA